MINTLYTIYHAKDLTGEPFLTPLKTYNRFFAEKIKNSSGFQNVVWRIAQVVCGIFAYPVIGALALIGLAIKYTGISALKEHNQKIIKRIEGMQVVMKSTDVFRYSNADEELQQGAKMSVILKCLVDKNNIDRLSQKLHEAIDFQTSKFQKVFLSSKSEISSGVQQLEITLSNNKYL